MFFFKLSCHILPVTECRGTKKLRRRKYTHLTKIVKIILAVEPAIGRSFVEAVSLVGHVRDVWTVAVVKRSFEQLNVTTTHRTKLSSQLQTIFIFQQVI